MSDSVAILGGWDQLIGREVQQTLQSVGSDMEIAATSSARLGKSVKHLEVSVKDMSAAGQLYHVHTYMCIFKPYIYIE